MDRASFWTVPRLWALVVVLVIGAVSFWPRHEILAHGPAPPKAAARNDAGPLPQAQPAADELRVRVVGQDGMGRADVGVVVELTSGAGAVLFSDSAVSDAEGRVLFADGARRARAQAGSARMRIAFVAEDPGELAFAVRDLPDRELILVRTVEVDRAAVVAQGAEPAPPSASAASTELAAQTSAPPRADATPSATAPEPQGPTASPAIEPDMNPPPPGPEGKPALELAGELEPGATPTENAAADLHAAPDGDAESDVDAALDGVAELNLPAAFDGDAEVDSVAAAKASAEFDPDAAPESVPMLDSDAAPEAGAEVVVDVAREGAAELDPGSASGEPRHAEAADPSALPIDANLGAADAWLAASADQPEVRAPDVPRGAIAGRVRLDVPARELFVEVDEILPLDPTAVGRRLGPRVLADDGSFHFEGVQAGLCAVRIGLFGSRRTLQWIEHLELAPGATLSGGRLAAVDLTGRLGALEVELFDPFGRRLERAVVLPIDVGSGTFGRLRQQAPGATPRVYFDRVGGPGGLDLRFEAPGHAPREVTVGADELAAGVGLRFVLEPKAASALELRLVGDVEVPTDIVAVLERHDGQVRPWDAARHRGRFDSAGRLRLQPAEVGAFVVRLLRGDGAALGVEVPIVLGPDDGERDVVFVPVPR